MRPFHARELSDGTLQYLCLLAALMSPRAPDLMALNEPESSIHPDLLPALAHFIVRASRHSQMWITTHSGTLASEIQRLAGAPPVALEKVDGETRLQEDQTLGRRIVTRGKRAPTCAGANATAPTIFPSLHAKRDVPSRIP